VGHVLEGSVRTSGTRLRVTAQLTDVSSGYQLWSQRYDREASDVFAVQDEIAAGVVEAVRARLSPGVAAIQPRPQVKSLDAYRHYLQGRHFRNTKNDHGSALREYEQAVALDPTHAPSWVGVAEVSILAAFYALIPATAAYARAQRRSQPPELRENPPKPCTSRASWPSGNATGRPGRAPSVARSSSIPLTSRSGACTGFV
jgi:hypothetical protein